MIIQPGVYNVTREQMIFLEPLVFDGKEYAITQERMYDYDSGQDPLSRYVQVKVLLPARTIWSGIVTRPM